MQNAAELNMLALRNCLKQKTKKPVPNRHRLLGGQTPGAHVLLRRRRLSWSAGPARSGPLVTERSGRGGPSSSAGPQRLVGSFCRQQLMKSHSAAEKRSRGRHGGGSSTMYPSRSQKPIATGRPCWP